MLLNYLLAILSGILLFAVHPQLSLYFLAPVALTPLLVALARAESAKHRFLLGYTCGLTFWAGVNYWIHFVLATYASMSWWLAGLAWVVFLILKAVHLGVFGWLAGILIHRPFAVPSIAALWVGLERAPTWFEYRWLLLGNAGIDLAFPMRLAPWTGVYGLSFLFALLSLVLAGVLLRRSRKELLWLALPAAILFLPELPPPNPAPRYTAVTIQPNIPERDHWTSAEAAQLHRKLEALSLQVALIPGKPYPALLLWPEMPAPVYYDDYPDLRERVRQLVLIGRAPLLMGTVATAKSGAPLNSALLISSAGDPLERYDKIYPVPFGEYVPWPFDGLVRQVSNEAGEFQPGSRVVVFPGENAGDKRRVGSFICYESAFPHFVRQFASGGATVFANLSNDGYFGATAARLQHLHLVRMRAAENRRWILRSTNDGVTASIDPSGRIVSTLPALVETSGRIAFDTVEQVTFYTRYGDLFAWGCLGYSLSALALTLMRSARPKRTA